MTLIKDLIEIPERVQRGDFVLLLAEGVNHPEETLREYVVTPELKACFDDALTFIHSALQTNTSKASYLHGSAWMRTQSSIRIPYLHFQGGPRASVRPLNVRC